MEPTAITAAKMLRALLSPARKLDLWLIFLFSHRLKIQLLRQRSGAYGKYICLAVLINVIPEGYPFCFERVFITVNGEEIDASRPGEPRTSLTGHFFVTLEPKRNPATTGASFEIVQFPPGVGLDPISLEKTYRSPDAIKGAFFFKLVEPAPNNEVEGTLTLQTGIKTDSLSFQIPNLGLSESTGTDQQIHE